MKPNLTAMSVPALIERFTTLGLGQYQAEDDIAKKNKLLREMWKVTDELQGRPGDQRSALLDLFAHPNAQVRLMAARLTLAIAPAAARDILQAIKDSKEQPQALDAGMCLWMLDEGMFKPA